MAGSSQYGKKTLGKEEIAHLPTGPVVSLTIYCRLELHFSKSVHMSLLKTSVEEKLNFAHMMIFGSERIENTSGKEENYEISVQITYM